MTALIPPDVATRCQSCGHDHADCQCTCTCQAVRKLAAGMNVLQFAALFCDRPPHDPHTDPLHHDDEDAIWWLEDSEASHGI